MPSFWKWLERSSIRLTPAVFTAVMLLLSAVFSHIPGLGQVMPLLVLINIYYWCMFYPGILPYWFLFVLGILQDTLIGQPLGISSFINILFAWALVGRFRILSNTSFATVWLRFIVLSCAIILLEWLMMTVYYGKLFSLELPLLQWLSSSLAYPPIHFFLTCLYHKVHE